MLGAVGRRVGVLLAAVVMAALVQPPLDVGESSSDVDLPPLVVGEILGMVPVVASLWWVGRK